ncbi:hypothetical protein QOZ80_9AG0670800 [Eleusine coracana subsp. coracana]|nr:hypothetical protein QOZ80_9AG0670800 [Eleusine coracana subsp. coracana]
MAEERQRFLCFEFLPKGGLDKYISDAARGLEWMTRYQIIKGICEGLHYLHKQNIVHLDLKPGNILLDQYMVPKIADFGLSKCFVEYQTRAMTSNIIGTQGYMAPESFGGIITFKSDIYSLGVIIIEILTGQKGYPQIENVLGSWSTRPDISSIIERLSEMERKCNFMKTDFYTSLATNKEKRSTELLPRTPMVPGETSSEPEPTGSGDKVKLEIIGRVKSISSKTGANEFAVMVRVTAPLRSLEGSRAGLDLVAVLDINATMLWDNKFDRMKEAMLFVIDNLGPNDRLAIVPFSDQVWGSPELSIMSDVNRERARCEIYGLALCGVEDTSNMRIAIKKAVQILRKRRPEVSSNRVGRIIFLSDGEDGLTLRNTISPNEFPAETFGFGADHDPIVLRYIADKTMGLYSYVNQDLDKIKDAFAQSLGGLMSITAMDVQVKLRTLDGVTISSIESGNYTRRISSDKQSGIIQLGRYMHPKIRKEATIMNDSVLGVLRPKVETSDVTVCPDVAAELIRLRLMEYVWVTAAEIIKGNQILRARKIKDPSLEKLQRSWEEIKGSEDGRSASETNILALDKEFAEMQHKEGFPFMLSWLSSHGLQCTTTKGSPSKSFAFRVKAMDEMRSKVDAERNRLV